MNHYDYIILGAGASGLMLAYRMAKDPFFDSKSVLIIDKQKTKATTVHGVFGKMELVNGTLCSPKLGQRFFLVVMIFLTPLIFHHISIK